jgi:hypothetical protein
MGALTSSVLPVSRSWTNTSERLSVSSETRFEAFEVNATKRPLALIALLQLSPFPWAPVLETLTLVVAAGVRALAPARMSKAAAPRMIWVPTLFLLNAPLLYRASVREHRLSGKRSVKTCGNASTRAVR